LDLNIHNKKVCAKIGTTRIDDDITNLPRVIQVVRPKNPQSALMILVCGYRALTTHSDPKLQPAHLGPISGRG
jgi:hypothetical protein